MKLKSYSILFRVFSFMSDKTNGAPFFVKYKLFLGTILIGLISSSAKASAMEKLGGDSIPSRPIPAEISCYRVASHPTSDQNSSPEIEIRGVVKDDHGELLLGTSVSIKNSNVGTVADIDGNFSIHAKPNDILVFSFIAYKAKEIPVSEIKDGKVTVVLEEDSMIMCYVVVITKAPYNDDIYTRAQKKMTKLTHAEVDKVPVSPVGTIRDFENWVQNNIQYSEQMKNDKVNGQVILSFAVDKKGKLVDKKVIAKLSKEADQEALRALSLSDKWQPGMNGNKPVKTTMTITVNFKAQ